MAVYTEMDSCAAEMALMKVEPHYVPSVLMYKHSSWTIFIQCTCYICVQLILYSSTKNWVPPLRILIVVSYPPPSLHTQVSLESEDYGKHLAGVQDLIQKHTLAEADVTAVAERVKAINTQAQKFVVQS